MNEDLLAQREEALIRKRPAYAKALCDVKDFDPKPLVDLIFSFNKGDSAEHAIFVLAQCQMLLKPFKDHINLISHYQREEETLHNLRQPVKNG
jgi:hypothetical protein